MKTECICRDTPPPAQPVAAQGGKSGARFQIYSGLPGKGYFSKELLTKTKPILLAQEERCRD
jgi:hypothetical protein